MNRFVFPVLLGLLLLLSGCAVWFPMQTVSATSMTTNASVFINGQSVIEGDKLFVWRKRPVVVTAYRYGHRTRSELLFPSQINPALLVSGSLMVSAIAVGPSEPEVFAPYAAIFAIDCMAANKRHKKTLVIGEMEKLKMNSTPSFRLWAHPSLDTLAVEEQYEVQYDKGKQFVKASSGKRVPPLDRDRVDTLVIEDRVDNILSELGYQASSPSLFAEYEKHLLLDARMKEFVIHEVSGICHRRVLEMDWIVRDIFGRELYTHSVTGESQVFSNTGEGYSDSFEDAMYHAIIILTDDPGFQELQQQLAGVQQRVFDQLDRIDLPGGGNKTISRKEEIVKSQVTLINKNAHASGCVISPEGHILCTYRIVGQKEKINVQFSNGRIHPAQVLRADPYTNTVLLKADTSGTAFLRPLADRSHQIGDEVFSVGTPVSRKLSQSLTTGIISAERTENGVVFLQTDVKISRGANGSPLINQKGELIGLVNEKYTGHGIEGLSFAVSSADILQRLKIQYIN
ncbi:MAG: S1C family serine protease [Flavobacteriales bacterium]